MNTPLIAYGAPPIPGFDQAQMHPGFAKMALLGRAARRFLALYDSGELTTEALRELAIEMRKVVG